MSILAIVPARSGSTRLKNKNMRPFLGRPLMDWTVEQALRIKEIDHVVVTTDYERRKQWKGATYIRRPTHLCGPDVPMAQVICDVLSKMEWPELVVLLQPTSPTRTDETIKRCVAATKKSSEGMALSRVVYIPTRTSGDSLAPNGACYVFPPTILPPFQDDFYMETTDDIDINTLADFRRAEAIMRKRCA